MDDNKFWLCAWSLLGAFFLSLVALSVVSDWHEDVLRADIIAEAQDPMLAACAFDSYESASTSRVPYCTMYLSRGK